MWILARNIVCGNVVEKKPQIATLDWYPQVHSQRIIFVAICNYKSNSHKNQSIAAKVLVAIYRFYCSGHEWMGVSESIAYLAVIS